MNLFNIQIAKEGKTASGNNQQETPKDPRVVFPVKRPPHLRSKVTKWMIHNPIVVVVVVIVVIIII